MLAANLGPTQFFFFCPFLQWHTKTQLLSGLQCPHRTYPPRKTPRIVSRHVLSWIRSSRSVLAKLSLFHRQKGFFFFPFLCTDWRNSVHLSSNHRSREQVPKQFLLLCYRKPWAAETHAAERHTRTTTYQGEDDIHSRRDTFFIVHGETWRLRKVLIVVSQITTFGSSTPNTIPSCPSQAATPTLHVLYPSSPSVLPRRLTSACVLPHMVWWTRSPRPSWSFCRGKLEKHQLWSRHCFRWLWAEYHNNPHCRMHGTSVSSCRNYIILPSWSSTELFCIHSWVPQRKPQVSLVASVIECVWDTEISMPFDRGEVAALA